VRFFKLLKKLSRILYLIIAPVEAYIDRLFLLAVPNSSIKYNEHKEEQEIIDNKKSELERIQLAKKLVEEKSKN
jgi:vacuolar protein sorting-associated protein 13A/C